VPSPEKIIVGLGNPGPDYLFTRHNIGFMAVDSLAHVLRAKPWQKKYKAEIATAHAADRNLLLIKPHTFMNLSGESVGEAMRFFKLSPDQVIVFHDDIDLAPGKVKVKQGGGNGGHNGLKSLDAHIGPHYWRVRLGVGHPGNSADVSNYVLGAFAKADRLWLEPLLEALTDEIDLLLADKPADFMNRIAARKIKGPEPKTADSEK
jgi:PTH1 family peptidyl-tRNA hydrolase